MVEQGSIKVEDDGRVHGCTGDQHVLMQPTSVLIQSHHSHYVFFQHFSR